MRLATVASIAVVSVCLAVSVAQGQPGQPGQPGGWKLLSGLKLDMRSLDVSPDSKLALFWGSQPADPQPRKSCWTVDLGTGQIDDLLALAGPETAAAIGPCKEARFSPGGRHVAILSATTKAACIVELATHKAVVPAAYVLSVPNLFWAGIPLLTHGLVMLFRNELQEYRFHKSSYAAWHPDISDWFIGIVLALGGGALLWQWHPTYLPAAVGWAIAAALCTVVSIVLWRWSSKD